MMKFSCALARFVGSAGDSRGGFAEGGYSSAMVVSNGRMGSQIEGVWVGSKGARGGCRRWFQGTSNPTLHYFWIKDCGLWCWELTLMQGRAVVCMI